MSKKPQWKLNRAEGQPWNIETIHSKAAHYGDTEWYYPASIGRRCVFSNGAKVREHYGYNGSGSKAFNGVMQWPVVSVEVSLPEGRLDLRTDLADLLKKVVRDFLTNHCE